MELKQALKEQYHAGLAMLMDCVEKCPNELWTRGEFPRTFWRIAFHAAYFAQLYMGQNEAAFQPWPGQRETVHPGLWVVPAELEPFDLPEDTEVYVQDDILNLIFFVDSLVDSTVNQLDLETDESGFSWYKNTSKLSHQLLNLRHLQGHVGQLSELLMQQGIDTKWVSQSDGITT